MISGATELGTSAPPPEGKIEKIAFFIKKKMETEVIRLPFSPIFLAILESLPYGLTKDFVFLVFRSLLVHLQPLAPVGEEMPVGVLVALFEGIAP